MTHARVLAAGLLLAILPFVVTHPVALLGLLLVALWFVRVTGVRARAPWLLRLALVLGLSAWALNALFSWHGSTELWRAPFTVTLLGRPRLTLEALVWGGLAGAQIATAVLASTAATLSVPPETLHRALVAIGLPRGLATAGGLALRLVPDLTRDARALSVALSARGVETGTLRGKAQTLVPLTARALDRAGAAEEALLLRGGVAPVRRPRVPLSLAAMVVGSLALAGWGAFRAGLRASIYPSIAIDGSPVTLVLVGLIVLVPALLVRGVAARS